MNNMDTLKRGVEQASTAMSQGGPEVRAPRASHMMSSNEGPADIIAKVSGAVKGGKREDDAPYFTNNEGIPLVSDVHLLQKQQTFNRSKNLERMVHPCGSGAFGYFECTSDVADLTKADFLQTPGTKTPIFVRFSTVTLGREFPDAARNPRGFAIKYVVPPTCLADAMSNQSIPRLTHFRFYTREGNYDIVGLNFPVFFCRDPVSTIVGLLSCGDEQALTDVQQPDSRSRCDPVSIPQP